MSEKVFEFKEETTRHFDWIDNKGEPKREKVKISLPAVLRVTLRYQPKKQGKTVTVTSPISGEELVFDLEKALNETARAEGKATAVKDEVEGLIVYNELLDRLHNDIERKKLDGIIAIRKVAILGNYALKHPAIAPRIEREIEAHDPVSDASLHGIHIVYGVEDVAKEVPEIPNDRELLSTLGVKTKYANNLIIRATGSTPERFIEAWKDTDRAIEDLETFEKEELARLENQRASSREEVQDVILNLVAELKKEVKKQKKAQIMWQKQRLQDFYGIMFPTSKVTPRLGWDYDKLFGSEEKGEGETVGGYHVG